MTCIVAADKVSAKRNISDVTIISLHGEYFTTHAHSPKKNCAVSPMRRVIITIA